MKRKHGAALAALVAAAAVALALTAATEAGLSPPTASFTLRAGTGTTETKTVTVPATPPSADVEIAIDTTGSMAAGIADAESEASAIVSGVQGSVANTDFAVVAFKDNVDGSGEYNVVQSMTPTASAITAALGTLGAGGGGDPPEAQNLVFHNSYTPLLGDGIGWRSGTRKFVVMISDAEPHGAGSAGIPGCTDTSADPHGLNTATELAGMAAAQRTLLMIREVDGADTTTLACYQGLAAAAFSGGAAVDSGGSGLATQIVTLINAAFATVNNVHLEVVSAAPAPATPAWITLPAPLACPCAAPGTYTFGPLGINVPLGTPAGTYSFDIRAVADGIDIGHQALTVVVPQKMLTLSPATDTDPIGGSHTVTAHVFDTLGPYVGDTVSFAVAGGPAAVPSSGSGTTNGSGDATFTFSNTPPNPGTNTITATDGALSATATKTWFNSPPNCSAVTADITSLWPPNHKLHTITVSGATDPDIGDSATLVVDGITQDEPVNDVGDGNTAPDGFLTSPLSDQAQVRAERSGLGDGRVYRLHFTATDTHGATCTGFVTVGVPHDQGGDSTPVDSAPPSYNSLLP
jgi:hypothetical protein